MKDLGRAGWACAILILLVVVLMGGLLLVKTTVDGTALEVDAKTTEREALLKRLQLPVRTASATDEQKNEFIEGANYALAANALQQRVVGVIEASGGKLVTVGIDPPDNSEKDAPGRRIVVQAVSELNNDSFQEVMYQLESARPFVLVDNLNVHRLADRSGPEGGDAQQAPRLSVDFRVYGYYRNRPVR
jgi:hypothetical protein